MMRPHTEAVSTLLAFGAGAGVAGDVTLATLSGSAAVIGLALLFASTAPAGDPGE